MALDADVALLGTGVAPLVAASRLIAEGKSIILLNPDYDFFREDSELPIDPLLPGSSGFGPRLGGGSADRAVAELRPTFPGALELWPPPLKSTKVDGGYRDPEAPHVRARSRLWILPKEATELEEDLYLRASE